MPIAINGSGSITGISAGGLPDGVITTDDLASTVPVAKAWVNFNGTGTVAIRASYNVSSITDNNVGDYTVNFTTALADANACYVATVSDLNGNRTFIKYVSSTSSAVRVKHIDSSSNTNIDEPYVNVAVFR